VLYRLVVQLHEERTAGDSAVVQAAPRAPRCRNQDASAPAL